MNTKTIGTLLIAGLVVLSAMVVFTSSVAAYTDEEFENAPEISEQEEWHECYGENLPEDPIDPIWYGQVTNAGTGDPMPGLTVKLYKKAWFGVWYLRFLGSDTTDANGDYSIINHFVWPQGEYYLRISDGTTTEEYPRYLYWSDYNTEGCPWTCLWNQTTDIPEFATIAIPSVAVLGLFLFFNKRKHKKE